VCYPFLFLYDDKYHTVPLARETVRAHVHRRKQAQPLAHGEPHGSLNHGGAMPAVRQPKITRLPRGQKRGRPVSTPACRTGRASRAREIGRAWGIRRLPASTPPCRPPADLRAGTGRASRAALFASRSVLRDREINRPWGIRRISNRNIPELESLQAIANKGQENF
jgi:hypothetical protein